VLAAVDEVLPFDPLVRARFRFPLDEGAGIAMLHETGRVLATHYDERYCEIDAEVPESVKRRLEPWSVPEPSIS
jgi:hypothetical protein